MWRDLLEWLGITMPTRIAQLPGCADAYALATGTCAPYTLATGTGSAYALATGTCDVYAVECDE